MKTWTLDFNGLKSGTPDVIWKFRGEENLYLVMRPPYLREATIAYSMVRCPPGQEWNPRSVESVVYLEGGTPSEFQRIFHERYPNFPLPEDIQEKYDAMESMQLNFLKKMGINPDNPVPAEV